MDLNRLRAAYEKARADLLAERDATGHWVGELATSALSTATAISALAIARRANADAEFNSLIDGGVRYLVSHQNTDGGWGDTDRSYSNIATTMLGVAALHLAERAAEHSEILRRANDYIASRGGIAGLRRRYGKDKTFAVPILTNYALAGLVDWREVSPLPFEAACLPQKFYRFVKLPVVSYAIPALVGIGQARFFHRPPRFWPWRWLRSAAVNPSLQVLSRMQPASGGYLEAVPLTSFVVMSLAATGRAAHDVARNGLRFIRESVRPDGSWPIDTNLATWNTTLAIVGLDDDASLAAAPELLDWVLRCQFRETHPFTGADPGGWGWSDLSGAVPDADDTPSALLALRRLRDCGYESRQNRSGSNPIDDAVRAGVRWLLDLQNRDGGWPTFCRGWGTLPFDRSGSDLTAHALRAFRAWLGANVLSAAQEATARRAIERGFAYVRQKQRPDGSWVPLWFGNQDHPQEENPIYGTAKVLLAYRDFNEIRAPEAQLALRWLTDQQKTDGGWGSVEETALAVEALLADDTSLVPQGPLAKGLDWLMGSVETSQHLRSSPIGFYFAKLWYYEKLYPLTFTVTALGRAVRRWQA